MKLLPSLSLACQTAPLRCHGAKVKPAHACRQVTLRPQVTPRQTSPSASATPRVSVSSKTWMMPTRPFWKGVTSATAIWVGRTPRMAMKMTTMTTMTLMIWEMGELVFIASVAITLVVLVWHPQVLPFPPCKALFLSESCPLAESGSFVIIMAWYLHHQAFMMNTPSSQHSLTRTWWQNRDAVNLKKKKPWSVRNSEKSVWCYTRLKCLFYKMDVKLLPMSVCVFACHVSKISHELLIHNWITFKSHTHSWWLRQKTDFGKHKNDCNLNFTDVWLKIAVVVDLVTHWHNELKLVAFAESPSHHIL